MKVDAAFFNLLNEASRTFKNLYEEDNPKHDRAYPNGRHVYSIEVHPETEDVRLSVAWPTFKRLVEEHMSSAPASYTWFPNMAACIHWECDVQGIQVVSVMYKWDLRQEFELLGLTDINFERDIRNIYREWQEASGWNLCCP